MREGNVRPSESACGRPTPPPLGCVRSRERRAWPASAHVWDRTARSGTRLLCPSITIGVAVVRVCATGFQPPWGPWPLRHVRRRTGCLRSVANVLEPVVWTTPQPSLGRNVVRMSQVLPSQGSANGWPSGYRHLDATHILGPAVLRCARVSPAALVCLIRGVAGGASQERRLIGVLRVGSSGPLRIWPRRPSGAWVDTRPTDTPGCASCRHLRALRWRVACRVPPPGAHRPLARSESFPC